MSCDTLSRLKGIETKNIPRCSLYISALAIRFPVWRELKRTRIPWKFFFLTRLRYAFPFEGNWNSASSLCTGTCKNRLAIRFPVWRELKQVVISVGCAEGVACDTLSRLKGIETLLFGVFYIVLFGACDTLSRLKGIETTIRLALAPVLLACDTLSRLKGIETLLTGNKGFIGSYLAIRFPVWRELKHYWHGQWELLGNFLRYAFPFEGNWNVSNWYWTVRYFQLAIRFPVWRELKPSGDSLHDLSPDKTCDTLSRLKGIETLFFWASCVHASPLQFTFPFEGNWNLFEGARYTYFVIPCNSLSRLKGIETIRK